MKKLAKLFSAAAATLIFSFQIPISAGAETRYISDVLYVPIRSGPGNEFRFIQKALRSGTSMELLEVDESGDWSKVVLNNGTEGWVRTQYIQDNPTAKLLLAEAQTKLNKALGELETLNGELQELKESHGQLQQTAENQSSERDHFAKELKELKALSADAVNLNTRYQNLVADHELMRTECDSLRAENDRLKSDKQINQWLFGAGLVVLGMILMLVLPAFRPKRRSTEWAN